ncbi:MAG: FHA domain-containing protein [Thermoproteota archaeon]
MTCQSNLVQVGFERKLVKIKTESFNLTLVIFSGSNSIFAGEFNVSYSPKYVNLTKIEAGKYWTITKMNGKYVFYRTPPVSNISDKTTLAVLTFQRNASLSLPKLNISLTLFKVADEFGNDLTVNLINETTTVIFQPREQPEEASGGPSGPIVVPSKHYEWFLVDALALAAVILLSALYLRSRGNVAYFLIGNGFSIPVSKSDTVFGREDFSRFLSADKLVYITRKNKGGQFRIVRSHNYYYIIDSYSTNNTYVNGVNIRGRGYVLLNNGDRISVPNVFELKFVIEQKR